jgi:hypothetical protein
MWSGNLFTIYVPFHFRFFLSFSFLNLEQSSAEKAGIQPTYQAPFQEAVTSPLPMPLGVELNSVLLFLESVNTRWPKPARPQPHPVSMALVIPFVLAYV